MKTNIKMTLIVTAILAANNVNAHKTPLYGQQLFESKCAKCHGKNGAKGFFGAANLQTNRKSDTELQHMISKGRNFMPSWEKRLSPEQMKSVITYIKTLRK